MSHDRELPKQHEFRGAKRRVEVALANYAVSLEGPESVGGPDAEGRARGIKVMRDLRTVLAAAEHAYGPCESSACKACVPQ